MSMPRIECTNIDQCTAASSVLQSVALEATAISHILNAEGEKIQKALSLHNCDCKDILEVNKSVQDTVDKITNLELVLKSKLDLVTPLLECCCKKPQKEEELSPK